MTRNVIFVLDVMRKLGLFPTQVASKPVEKTSPEEIKAATLHQIFVMQFGVQSGQRTSAGNTELMKALIDGGFAVPELDARGDFGSLAIQSLTNFVAAAEHPLYDRLGRKSGIEMAVKFLVALLLADGRINCFFVDLASNLAKRVVFERQLVAFICALTGGPEKYTGQSMNKAHKGMGIEPYHFAVVRELISQTLDHFRVKSEVQSELSALLTRLRDEIVSQ